MNNYYGLKELEWKRILLNLKAYEFKTLKYNLSKPKQVKIEKARVYRPISMK